MTTVFGDGFDGYTALLQQWTTLTSSNATIGAYGRFGTNGLRTTGVAFQSVTLTKNFGGSNSTIYLGFALRPNFSGGTSNPYVGLVESGTLHLYFEVNRSTGETSIRHGGSGALLLAGPTISPTGNIYSYYEIKAVIHDSAGTLELRVNEAVYGSASSLDTRNGGTGIANSVAIFMGDCNGAGAYVDYDDIYVDTANYLGDVKFKTLLPNNNGNSSQWMGSDSNQTDNYLLVDDSPPNDDTDYVFSNTVGHTDTYAIPDLTETGAVKAVIYYTRAKKDDAGARNIAPVLRVNTTDYNGTTRSLSTDYVTYSEIFEQNPETVTAWTISDINALQIGQEVIA